MQWVQISGGGEFTFVWGVWLFWSQRGGCVLVEGWGQSDQALTTKVGAVVLDKYWWCVCFCWEVGVSV